jgi:biopolymer transport protein ExbD
MRFPRNKQIFRGQLDVGAFLGVFFVLVIFVMLNSSLVFTPGLPIHLPDAEDLPGIAGETLIMAVDASGQFYFDNQLTPERLLKQRLAEEVNKSRQPLTLVVEADKNVSWDTLKNVALLARKAGIKNVFGATRPAGAATNSAPELLR